MTSPRSMFTEAIEDHLALKKQNAHLSDAMPIARYSVGDPLDRYPGGPVRPAVSEEPAGPSIDAVTQVVTSAAAGGIEPVAVEPIAAPVVDDAEGGRVVEGEFRRPLEPLAGMAPMLSLVEDIEDDEADTFDAPAPTAMMPAVDIDDIEPAAPVLRFPGGVGPRGVETGAGPDEPMAAAGGGSAATMVVDEVHEHPTGEQPVIVIDADEPLAPQPITGAADVPAPAGSRSKRSLFGALRRRHKDADEAGNGGWFSGAPRDFTWDD